MSPWDTLLAVEDLSYRYGERLAVDRVSFEVRRGEVLGLLGPNGAGKTTAISCIAGLLTPAGGRLVFGGQPFTPRRRPADRARLGRVRAVPDAKLQELRERLEAARWERRELDDRLSSAGVLRNHLERLLGQQERAFTDQVAAGKPDPAAREQVLAFSSAQLLALAAQARDTERQMDAVDLRIADLETQLGHLQSQLDLLVRDVIVETLLPGPATLDLEDLVGDCGWAPLYDLRTAADGASVDLAYRAHAWQRTGEAWPGVDLALSTAQPQRGAQGPEPVPLRLRLADDRYPAPEASAARGRREDMGVALGEGLKDERWLKDLQEKGIRTWRVAVPRGGAADVTFMVVTRWPENTRLQAGS